MRIIMCIIIVSSIMYNIVMHMNNTNDTNTDNDNDNDNDNNHNNNNNDIRGLRLLHARLPPRGAPRWQADQRGRLVRVDRHNVLGDHADPPHPHKSDLNQFHINCREQAQFCAYLVIVCVCVCIPRFCFALFAATAELIYIFEYPLLERAKTVELEGGLSGAPL